MFDTVTRYLEGLVGQLDRQAVRSVVVPMADKFSSQALNSAGLAIKTGGSALAKIGASDFYAVANGVLVKIAASTDMPALTGINITAANFNVVCFFVDQGGTVTAAAGTEATAIASVKWPQFPAGKALVGTLLITYASAFTGGTTALDTATTVYLNTGGAFDPTVLV
jgi:hypothetical protein